MVPCDGSGWFPARPWRASDQAYQPPPRAAAPAPSTPITQRRSTLRARTGAVAEVFSRWAFDSRLICPPATRGWPVPGNQARRSRRAVRDRLSPARVPVRSTNHHGPQSERTMSWRWGATGSLVRTTTKNSCGPPMPACMVKIMLSVVDCPGWMVVEPTTASGGQHPFSALTGETSTIRSGTSPALVRVNTALARPSYGKRPRSISLRSTTRRGVPPEAFWAAEAHQVPAAATASRATGARTLQVLRVRCGDGRLSVRLFPMMDVSCICIPDLSAHRRHGIPQSTKPRGRREDASGCRWL